MEVPTTNFTSIALIGDGYVGKTCVMNCLQKLAYSPSPSRNVYNEITLEKITGNKQMFFKIMYVAGREEYDLARKNVYEKADIFVLCFCVADKVSYENITSKWLSDVHQYKSKPIILLGTKVDLRINSPSVSISRDRGIRLQKRIGAKYYVECSAKSGEGISSIIDAAANVLLKSDHKKSCEIQ